MNPLGKKIGIIGGGQLGKMMILEAKKMGFYVVILDPDKDCPAHSISDRHIVAGFDDKQAIYKLSQDVDIITYEFEHIDYASLLELEENGSVIYPTAKSLKMIQNKLTQKLRLREYGLPVPEFTAVCSMAEMAEAGKRFGFPMLLKACTGGYDGKGNYVVRSLADCENAFQTLGGGKLPLMAEKFVDFVMEVSALACRGTNGEIAVYPIAQNIHENNILIETRVPAAISGEMAKAAMRIAYKVMEAFEGVGMFCVEMFMERDGNVSVNEVAPRPHNSGHYSIEGCVTSQFEQHIRAVASLPLGDVSLIRPAVMRNILGEEEYCGRAVVLGAERALAVKGAMLHIYGKRETRPKRKMGHVTVTADTLEEAAEKAAQAQEYIKIISLEDM